MGIYSPEPRREGFGPIGYGRFRFASQKVVKWNCVFRLTDRVRGITPEDYHFRNFVIIGELLTVRDTLEQLHGKFEGNHASTLRRTELPNETLRSR